VSKITIASALSWLLIAAAGAAGADLRVAEAARRGDAAALRVLVQEHVSVSTPEPDGTTPLHWAVQRDDLAMTDVLLRAGADARAANRYGVAPMYLAALNGSAAILEKLMAAGADANQSLPAGETPLMTAARNGSVDAIAVLLSHGARLNEKEQWKGQTALMWAATGNNAAAIRALVKAGADVNARTKSGAFSAFLFAARDGRIDAARALIDSGANVNETLPDGTSALLLAVMNAHYDLAGMLLDQGADPNADAQGWAPLHQIAWSRRPNNGSNIPGAVPTGTLDSLDLVGKLLDRGADVNAREKKEPRDGFRNMLHRIGATPFLLAAKSCDLPLMRLLLERGADPALTTDDGTTALMVAAGVGIWAPGENPGTEEEALAAVKLLLDVGGGGVNDVDTQGETALHGAIYRAGSISVAKLLIDKGAKLDARNKKGWTPLTAADGVEYTPNVLKRYPDAAAFLRKAMADRGLPVPAIGQAAPAEVK